MIIDFTTLQASDYAAWWGAIIASLTLTWNIVVAIRSGARLKIYVTPNMELHPPHPGKEGQRYIHVRAVNNGTLATTITHFCGYTAKTQFHSVTKNVQPFIIMNGNFNIPFKLKPGEKWTGLASQDMNYFRMNYSI
ncbi:MAG: hypothetical protein IBX48_02135 [Thiomicrospira sp.]|uniref:hypothetical protein n=1 Tax=Thiomicrospira sp. TaxID=935 RepID=UPI001A0DCD00|nr:hypothetical protein [Thiomicrospira sp.]MBE0493117.1 hypothetical protein [Thiomicrospira sp.]